MAKEVPNVNPETGVSSSYRLAYGSLSSYLGRVANGEDNRSIFLARRSYLSRRILRYEEYFKPEEYQDVVTEQNEETVKLINSVVDEINKMREDQDLDHEKLTSLVNRIEDVLVS